MSVRAKFKLHKIEISTTTRYPRKEDGGHDYQAGEAVELRSLHFNPVYANNDPNHENSKFWDASPSGSLVLGTINPAAWNAFELDGEYYLDFTKAD